MCFAVIRVSYKVASEPATLAEVASEEELLKKIEELSNRDGVRKITYYKPHKTIELVSEWKETIHETID